MIPIIITGAGGQLGKAFIEILKFADGFNVYSFDKRQLDISDKDKVFGVLRTIPKTKYWINCAAYTRVDEAESHPEIAFLYNAVAPGNIAEACRDAGVHYIDFSSDYVYHNALRRPLVESDPTEPKGIYAKSKLAGETAIQSSGASYSILRTSWVYGPGGNNFVNTMMRLGPTHPKLRIVSDQVGAPTFTYDIVEAVKTLIQKQQMDASLDLQGIFNFANAGEVTWADFAQRIFNLTGMNVTVDKISSEEYGAPAPRPAYSVLDCSRISSLLSLPIPHWDTALQNYLTISGWLK